MVGGYGDRYTIGSGRGSPAKAKVTTFDTKSVFNRLLIGEGGSKIL